MAIEASRASWRSAALPDGMERATGNSTYGTPSIGCRPNMYVEKVDYQVSLSENSTFVRIRVYRPMTSDLGRRLGTDAMRLAAEKNINKYLFDVRRAPNVQSTADNYDFATKDIKDFRFPKDSRSAFLIKAEDSSHDFIEAAFQQAGYNVKIFVDESSAVSWLEKEQGA